MESSRKSLDDADGGWKAASWGTWDARAGDGGGSPVLPPVVLDRCSSYLA